MDLAFSLSIEATGDATFGNGALTEKDVPQHGLSCGLIHPRPGLFERPLHVLCTAGQNVPDLHRTPVRTLGKRVVGNPSRFESRILRHGLVPRL